jgi:hypothetical protein
MMPLGGARKPVEGGLDIGRSKPAAVVEVHVRAELEGVGQAIRRDVPTLCHVGLKLWIMLRVDLSQQ